MMPSKDRINNLIFRNKEADIEAIPQLNNSLVIYLFTIIIWRGKSALHNLNAYWPKLLLEKVVKRCSTKSLFLIFLQNSQKKHFCWSLSVIKLHRLKSYKLIKPRLRCRSFLVNFSKFF